MRILIFPVVLCLTARSLVATETGGFSAAEMYKHVRGVLSALPGSDEDLISALVGDTGGIPVVTRPKPGEADHDDPYALSISLHDPNDTYHATCQRIGGAHLHDSYLKLDLENIPNGSVHALGCIIIGNAIGPADEALVVLLDVMRADFESASSWETSLFGSEVLPGVQVLDARFNDAVYVDQLSIEYRASQYSEMNGKFGTTFVAIYVAPGS